MYYFSTVMCTVYYCLLLTTYHLPTTHQLGELNLEWYSNGQCPSTTDATFHVWNAVLLGATPLGAPLTPNPVNPGLSPNIRIHIFTLTRTLEP